MTLLALVSLLLVAPLVVDALKCRQCGTFTCEPLQQVCKYGQTTDVCNCCPACAKGPGEGCGGPWNLKGKCQTELECVKPAGSEVYSQAEGTCETPIVQPP